MRNKIKKIVLFISLFIAAGLIIGSFYYCTTYQEQNFEMIWFYLTSGAKFTSPAVISSAILACLLPVAILMLIIWFPISEMTREKKFMLITSGKKEFKLQIYPINILKNHKIIYMCFIYIIAIVCFINNLGIDEYIKNNLHKTTIYEEKYVDGQNVNITFPENKRNLIIIVVESLENSLCSKKAGGGWNYSVIPELETLAKENINFSNTELIGGANMVMGTDFTAGGMVALTSGIPLKITSANTYKGTGKYLENVCTLGDILREQGYNLEIMMGSDGKFGGRTQYFTTNGEYKIFDVNYAIENNYMEEKDKKWWGFTDDKLFAWSKEEITKLSEEDKPFNYIMLTADTHFVDGYLSENAKIKFDTKYENVHAYSSKLIYEFIEWAKQQEFYDNTTFVIVGDHLGMQTEFYTDHIPADYQRTVYNCIINSDIEAKNTTNRQFFNGDLFPTMLASIGAKIEGERLGLGTNLFSDTPTLIEELGFEYVSNELAKKSVFYNKKILGDDYYIQQKVEEEEINMY